MPTADPDLLQVLERLSALPFVPDAVTAARDACAELRWHRALRRRTAEAAAEAGVRAARASGALAGARYPVELYRHAARGAERFPDDPAGRTAQGVLRALAAARELEPTYERAPAQALARLHTAAAAGVLPEEQLGRPRGAREEAGDGQDLLDATGAVVPAAAGGRELEARLATIRSLMAAPPAAPALVVAALVHAEIATARPFVGGNGVVARALCRAVVVRRGLDASGVAVWEAALLGYGPRYPLALAAYAGGTPDGVAGWLQLFARAVVDGAREGQAVGDAVVAGRLPA